MFERLYAGCFKALQRFCYLKLPSKADGDDVLQEVALAAWSHRESVRNPAAFKPWLLQIAANKIRDFYRKRAKQFDLPLDETVDTIITQSRFGVTVEETVRDTLDALSNTDRQILSLFYLQNVPQAEIARRLGIPTGTVKSRLHTARGRFKNEYPYPIMKGEKTMSKLPKTLPEYTITKTGEAPFDCKWEEMMGWFIVPKLGESLSYAMYDMPGRNRTEVYELEVAGRANVHGIDGVEIIAHEQNGGEHEGHGESRNLTRTFVAQLTDTHCRILAESHMHGDVKHYFTFLDGDDFLGNWGFGEDNCGNDIYPKCKGIIKHDGAAITCPAEKFVLDIIDRCTVTIGDKEYDTIRVMDIECYNTGIVSEQYLDRNGRTVLWRRFNRDDWHFDYYKQKWSGKLPENERLTVNGETYVHWYDCIADYIL
jgi:RNA polymerase sigma factor (sigma-70 family)